MPNERERRPLAFLVDAHGTLFHEHPPRHLIYAAAMGRHGLNATPDEIAQVMGLVHASLPRRIDGHFRYTEGWFRVYVAEVAGRLRFEGELEPLTHELLTAFRVKSSFRAYPEARAVVKRLRGAKIPIAVVSNWGPHLPSVLGQLGFHGDFDAIVASALAQVEKPDPSIFRKAARALNVPIEDCLHVGDHLENDYEGARAVGAAALWLRRDPGTEAPDGEANSIDSLRGVLARFGLPDLS